MLQSETFPVAQSDEGAATHHQRKQTVVHAYIQGLRTSVLQRTGVAK